MPTKAKYVTETCGERLPLASAIHYHDPSPAVKNDRVIDESNLVSVRRNSRVANPPIGLVEHLAQRIFQACRAVGETHACHLSSVRRPVRADDVLGELAGCTSAQREPGQGPIRCVSREKSVLQGDSQLIGARHSENTAAFQSEFSGLRRVSPRGVDFHGIASECGTVDDGLAIASKTCRVHVTSAESQPGK